MSLLKKKRSYIFASLFLVLLLGICLSTMPNTALSTAKAESMDISMFSFTQINATDCEVRLTNKTVETAIIPMSAEIGGQRFKVTTIASNGFSSATNLKKVRLPQTITTIGNTAFANCKKLETITMPSSLRSIGTNAFNLCSALEYMIIPKDVQTVGSTILRSTAVQAYVRITEAEATARGWASNWNGNNSTTPEYNSSFQPTIQLVKGSMSTFNSGISPMSIDEEVYYVDDYQPFVEKSDTGTIDVYIPAKMGVVPVVGIKADAFMYNTIDSLVIGYADDPLHVASYSFNGLEADSLTINRDLNMMDEDYAGNSIISEFLFADAMITTIALPNSITALGEGMFNGCGTLNRIYFIEPTGIGDGDYCDDNNKNYAKGIIATEEAAELSEPLDNRGIVRLDKCDNLTAIGDNAFGNATALKGLYIPDSVTAVGSKIVNSWGEGQTVSVPLIDFDQENLPENWDELWHAGCDEDIIVFRNAPAPTVSFKATQNGVENIQFTEQEIEFYEGQVLGDILTFSSPTSVSHNFTGKWYIDQSRTEEFLTSNTLVAELTLYAGWAIKTFSVAFDDHCVVYKNLQGVSLGDEIICDYGTTFQFVITADTCYTSTPTIKVNNITITPNGANIYSISNITSIISVTAQGQKRTYTINFNKAGGTGSVNSIQAEMHEPMPAIEMPTRTGYTFEGYFTQQNGQGVKYYNKNMSSVRDWDIASTTTLYAHWTLTSYYISYSLYGGTNNPNNPEFYTMNDTITLLAPTRNGYTFEGWYNSLYSSAQIVTTISGTGNKLVHAKWKLAEYTITYMVKINNTWYTTSDTYNILNSKTLFNINSVVGLGLIPGFSAVNTWYTNSSLTGTKYSSLPAGNYGNKTFYGSATAIEYTITLYMNDNVYGTKTYTVLDDVYLGVPPLYTSFDGWYGSFGPKVTVIEAFSIVGNVSFYATGVLNSGVSGPGYGGGIISDPTNPPGIIINPGPGFPPIVGGSPLSTGLDNVQLEGAFENVAEENPQIAEEETYINDDEILYNEED